MRQNQEVPTSTIVGSIDKILTYLEENIEKVDDGLGEQDDIIKHLVSVHGLLTRFKVAKLGQTPTDNTDEPLSIYAYMVMSSLTAVLGNWESKSHVIDGHILLANDIVYLDINMDEGPPGCIVSLYYKADPVIVAEVISTLKDIFGSMLRVSSECFDTDDITNGYIWGDEAIDNHLKSMNGVKVKPITIFNDDTIGNC